MGDIVKALDLIVRESSGANLEELARDIAKDQVKSTRKNIERGVSPNGKRFKPLAPSTIRSKRRKGQTLKPLIATRKMVDTLAYEVKREAKHVSAKIGATAKTKSGFPYPRVHQRGSRTVPARPFLGFSASDRKSIRSRVQKFNRATLNKAARAR